MWAPLCGFSRLPATIAARTVRRAADPPIDQWRKTIATSADGYRLLRQLAHRRTVIVHL
jgi:hypothetical protein